MGKVREVFPHSAQVLAINDQTSGAGVILETTRIRGILRGNAAGQPQIVGILADRRIQPGEAGAHRRWRPDLPARACRWAWSRKSSATRSAKTLLMSSLSLQPIWTSLTRCWLLLQPSRASRLSSSRTWPPARRSRVLKRRQSRSSKKPLRSWPSGFPALLTPMLRRQTKPRAQLNQDRSRPRPRLFPNRAYPSC